MAAAIVSSFPAQRPPSARGVKPSSGQNSVRIFSQTDTTLVQWRSVSLSPDISESHRQDAVRETAQHEHPFSSLPFTSLRGPGDVRGSSAANGGFFEL